MPEDLVVNDQITIAGSELQFSYARSSGPGGQNVNKLNTKATLRWSPGESPSLPIAVKRRFLERFASRLTGEGELVLQSGTHREQARNTGECLARLRALVLSIARPPKQRRPTKPSRASKERRLQSKQQRSQVKQLRRKPRTDD
ncbi:Peptidyl-tRNA hydrolase ArfB [Posidoniimonas polymericola]|uniref:Peptidyl-tRNA hydrolase ArfB n=1 Tax=Posidoniimonas polymericola TaxID=2528002 RepID=A0A5C5YLX1_9BACT|nr:alternative ribosome rescue aminoacyl-tRNA hydrolase ArfB [Posidoniimonas polymericola]TWT75902.1 Peptidyl-tRNA hydrolase ArfB [Posidoniimonas polymericola]